MVCTCVCVMFVHLHQYAHALVLSPLLCVCVPTPYLCVCSSRVCLGMLAPPTRLPHRGNPHVVKTTVASSSAWPWNSGRQEAASSTSWSSKGRTQRCRVGGWGCRVRVVWESGTYVWYCYNLQCFFCLNN